MIVRTNLLFCMLGASMCGMVFSQSASPSLPELKNWVAVASDAAVELRQLSARNFYSLPEYLVEQMGPKMIVKPGDSEKHLLREFEPIVIQGDQLSHPSSVLKTSEGWLCGFNRGEFGGGLWWYGDDRKAILGLSELPVISLKYLGERCLVLSRDQIEGVLSEVRFAKGKPTLTEIRRVEYESVTDLNSTVDGRLSILRGGGVLILGVGNEPDVTISDSDDVFQLATWRANSIAWESKSRCYLGGAGFIAVLDLKGGRPKVSFIAPDEKYRDTLAKLKTLRKRP